MKIYPVLVLFIYALISCTPSITEMVPENKIRISENIFFDNNTKRYVYYDNNTSVKIYRTKKLNNGSRVTGSAI